MLCSLSIVSARAACVARAAVEGMLLVLAQDSGWRLHELCKPPGPIGSSACIGLK